VLFLPSQMHVQVASRPMQNSTDKENPEWLSGSRAFKVD
jgi:hypothetical protein